MEIHDAIKDIIEEVGQVDVSKVSSDFTEAEICDYKRFILVDNLEKAVECYKICNPHKEVNPRNRNKAEKILEKDKYIAISMSDGYILSVEKVEKAEGWYTTPYEEVESFFEMRKYD